MKPKRLEQLTYALLLVALCVTALIVAKHLIMPLWIALFIATALWPLHKKVKLVLRYTILSASFVVFMVVLAFTALSMLIVFQANEFVDDFPNLSHKLEQMTFRAEQAINTKTGLNFSYQDLKRIPFTGFKYVSSYFSTAIAGINTFVSSLVLIPIYVFCLLIYQDYVKLNAKKLIDFVGLSSSKFFQSFKQIIHNYVKGLFLVTFLLGSFTSLVLYVLDVPYPIFLGFFTGIFCIIPYVGIILSGLIVLMVSYLTQGSLVNLLIITLSFGLIQFMEGNFLTPKIMGEKLNINPMISIISLLIGASIWGVSGMLVAIPTAAILLELLENITQKERA